MASHWLCLPPFQPARGPNPQSPPRARLPKKGGGRFRAFSSHVLSRPPLPPCVEAAKPVPLPPVAIATGRPLLPELPAPAPGRLAPLPLPEPGAGALEARPGRSRPPGARRPSRQAWEVVAKAAQDVRASHLPPRAPPGLVSRAERPPCACPGPPLPAAWPGGHSCWDSSGFWWPLSLSW